jgi:hypothetical protein
LNEWSVRALAFGYVQVIDAVECGRLGIECESDSPAEEIRAGAGRPVLDIAPAMFPSSDAQSGSTDLLASLDAAIAHCGRWRGEFWAGATAVLTDLRTVVAVAVEPDRPSEQPVGLLTIPRSRLQPELRVREEERVAHAVA